MNTAYHNPDEYWYYNQRYDINSGKNMEGCFYSLIGIIIIVLLCLFLSSCKTEYIPVETVRTEIRYNTDTVIVKDTVNNEKETIIREATPADSALLGKLGLQLDENKKIILLLQKELAEKSHTEIEHGSDTVVVEKEVQVPYPVEKKLTWWENIKMNFGGTIMLILFVALLIVLLKWFLKTKMKK